MSSVDSISSSASTLLTSDASSQAMSTQDFLKILVTELTNQDPFEPMNNQDLLDQISGIQQLESSQTMTNSLTSMTGEFGTLIEQMGTFLDSQNGTMSSLDQFVSQQKLSTASQWIGQTVSGINTEGEDAAGQVVSVSLVDDQVLLTLDNGEQINIDAMSKLEPTTALQDDTVSLGSVMKGVLDGETLVGTVESISIDGENVLLNLKTRRQQDDGSVIETVVQVPLSEADTLNLSTVGDLLGQTVEGFVSDGGDPPAYMSVTGVVESYTLTEDGLVLVLDTGETLSLADLASVVSSESE